MQPSALPPEAVIKTSGDQTYPRKGWTVPHLIPPSSRVLVPLEDATSATGPVHGAGDTVSLYDVPRGVNRARALDQLGVGRFRVGLDVLLPSIVIVLSTWNDASSGGLVVRRPRCSDCGKHFGSGYRGTECSECGGNLVRRIEEPPRVQDRKESKSTALTRHEALLLGVLSLTAIALFGGLYFGAASPDASEGLQSEQTGHDGQPASTGAEDWSPRLVVTSWESKPNGSACASDELAFALSITNEGEAPASDVGDRLWLDEPEGGLDRVEFQVDRLRPGEIAQVEKCFRPNQYGDNPDWCQVEWTRGEYDVNQWTSPWFDCHSRSGGQTSERDSSDSDQNGELKLEVVEEDGWNRDSEYDWCPEGDPDFLWEGTVKNTGDERAYLDQVIIELYDRSGDNFDTFWRSEEKYLEPGETLDLRYEYECSEPTVENYESRLDYDRAGS